MNQENTASPMMQTELHHTSSLNILRFLAASSVILAHMLNIKVFNNKHNILTFAEDDMFYQFFTGFLDLKFFGLFGVVLFFLISGFLIVGMQQRYSPRELFVNRIFRIFPLLIVSVFATSSMDFIPNSITQILANITLVYSFIDMDAINTVYWTLSVEMCFYFMAMYTVKWDIRKLFRAIYIIMIVDVLLVALSQKVIKLPVFYGLGYVTGYMGILFVGTVFALGGNRKTILKMFLLAIINLWIVNGVIHGTSAMKNTTIAAPIAILMFYSFLQSKSLNRLGSTTLWHRLSNATYGVYLLHFFVGYSLLLLISQYTKIVPGYGFLALWYILVVIMGYVISLSIEKWGIMAGRKIIGKMRNQTT